MRLHILPPGNMELSMTLQLKTLLCISLTHDEDIPREFPISYLHGDLHIAGPNMPCSISSWLVLHSFKSLYIDSWVQFITHAFSSAIVGSLTASYCLRLCANCIFYHQGTSSAAPWAKSLSTLLIVASSAILWRCLSATWVANCSTVEKIQTLSTTSIACLR